MQASKGRVSPLSAKDGRPVGQSLSRFMELRGRHVAEIDGVLWYSTEGAFYMSVPFQLCPEVDPHRMQQFLRAHRATGVRYPSLIEPGRPSGLYVCRTRPYDLSAVHRKYRTRIRHGLNHYVVRRASVDELLAQGLQLNLDTMSRQGRFDAEFGTEEGWRRLVRALGECPAMEAYGAFAGERLAAYVVACREDDWFHLIHQMSRQDELKDFPNHALTFAVTKMAMDDESIEAACLGLLPLIQREGLHTFKLRHGYELWPQNSVFHVRSAWEPWLASTATMHAARVLRRLSPANQRLERVETVLDGIRLSLDGRTGLEHRRTGQ